MTVLTLGLSVLVPWALGVAWLRGDARRDRPGTVPMVLGYGLLLGLLASAVVLLVWGRLGAPLTFWPVLGVLAVLAGAGLPVGRRWRWTSAGQPGPSRGAGWVLIGVLLALLAARWLGLAAEVLWRPMYPWDAWVNWAPRAKLWFGLGEITPILAPEAWLAAADPEQYTLPKHAYPATVPAVQLWTALALGRWDPALVNVTWLLAAAGLGLAGYGQLRRWGLAAAPALLGVYALLSLPMVNIHTALAGYADLWMGAAYGLAAMAFCLWCRDRSPADLALFLVAALLGVGLKRPGFVWALTFVPALAVARWGWRPVAAAAGAGALLVGLVLVVGVEFVLPGVGDVILSTRRIQVGGFTQWLHWNPTQGIFIDNLFVLPQWHLFWYLFCAACVAAAANRRRLPALAPQVTLLLAGFAFLLGVFFFTRLAMHPGDYTTINRALLHLAPAALFVAVTWLARVARAPTAGR